MKQYARLPHKFDLYEKPAGYMCKTLFHKSQNFSKLSQEKKSQTGKRIDRCAILINIHHTSDNGKKRHQSFVI